MPPGKPIPVINEVKNEDVLPSHFYHDGIKSPVFILELFGQTFAWRIFAMAGTENYCLEGYWNVNNNSYRH